MTHHQKIIHEAEQVIDTIEAAMLKQAGFKIGNPTPVVVPPDKQAKLDKLKSLLHYTCYLEQQNHAYFNAYEEQQLRINALEHLNGRLQDQINLAKKIEEL